MVYLYTEILQGIAKRPGLYFGPTPFLELCGYVQGCHETLRELDPGHPICKELDGWNDWLCERFQIESLPSFGWRQIISQRESDDFRRTQAFAELYLEYRQELATSYEDAVGRYTNPYIFRKTNSAEHHDQSS